MAYGRGWGLLLNNMCRYKKKKYGETFFPWFGILPMKILALTISWDQAKKFNI